MLYTVLFYLYNILEMKKKNCRNGKQIHGCEGSGRVLVEEERVIIKGC